MAEIETVRKDLKPAQVRSDSNQPRFSTADAEKFFFSVLGWVESDLEKEPIYMPSSGERDKWLSQVWYKEPHLAGVVNSVVSIDKNRGWTLVGGRNQVSKYTDILHSWESATTLNGWRSGTSMAALAYYTSDINTIIELGRDGKFGPLRNLYNVDSTLCSLSSSNDYPLRYNPPGDPQQKWEPLDFMRIASLPDQREEFNGLGHCAVSRCIELTKLMVAVYEHDREQLGSRAPRGILTIDGISQAQWEQAMQVREARLTGLEQEYFANVAVLASSGANSIELKLTALSNLPANFDLQTFTSLLMYGYALCFGYDPSEFYPVQFGSLGRGSEMEVQHEKATGKGKIDYAYGFQENLQQEIPPTLEFQFDERDDAGDLVKANVEKANAEVIKMLRDTGPGDLTTEEARLLWAEKGLIPREWTEVEEDVEADDTESKEQEPKDTEAEDTDNAEKEKEKVEQKRRRDFLLSKPQVRMAAETFLDEPIVEYSFPEHKVRRLADSGRRLLTPPRSYHFIARATLYEEGEIEITDEDVEQAIEEGKERLGEEFASLLLGEKAPASRSRWRQIFLRQDAHWYWDSGASHYVNQSGTVFSQTQIRGMVAQSTQFSQSYTGNLSTRLADGNISRAQFISGMREELKGEYIRQYMLGRGGYEQMTYRDWGSVGGSLADQYRYLEGFADDIVAGNMTEGQIRNRAGMYSNSAREAYSRGIDRMVRAWGADRETWVVSAGDNCPDCIDNQDEGKQEIGYFSMPGDGSTVCLTNCHCHKEYENSKTGEEYS